MARKPAVLPQGPRITDYISLGVIVETFPLERIREVLEATGRASVRQRALPAHVMMYLVVALALYMQSSAREVLRCLLEGLQWMAVPGTPIQMAGDAGISLARSRLGSEPVQRLHDEVVGPVAGRRTRGAWYRQWRTVSLDGGTLDVADVAANGEAFGRPATSRGRSALPKLRFVSLVEGGTHVLFGTRMGAYAESEPALSRKVVGKLQEGMLCLADRNFFGYRMWNRARSTGADLVCRLGKNQVLPCERRLRDGSYLSTLHASQQERPQAAGGVPVRVVEYRLEGVEGAEPLHRLVTSVLEPERAPALELAALYHERWEIETAFDALTTHLPGSRIVLRSKKPDLVRQEFYGLLLAHFAVRKLMHEAAVQADLDPDKRSFPHAVRVIRRKLPVLAATPPPEHPGPH